MKAQSGSVVIAEWIATKPPPCWKKCSNADCSLSLRMLPDVLRNTTTR